MDKAGTVFEKLAKKEDRTWRDALVGAIAGSTATALTMPLENIQINQAAKGSKYFRKPVLDVAKGLLSEGSLWAGTGSKLLKVAPTMGITFAVYELLKKQLNK